MSTTAADRTVSRTQVEEAMRNIGVSGTYISYAGHLAEHLSRRGVSATEVQTFARNRGASVSTREAQALVDRLVGTAPAAQSNGTSLRDAVTRALPMEARRYSNYVEPVITALEERERAMAEGIIEAGIEEGISRDDLLATLQSIGMTAPVMEVTSGGGDDEEAPSWARAIIDRLGRLEQVARDRGLLR